MSEYEEFINRNPEEVYLAIMDKLGVKLIYTKKNHYLMSGYTEVLEREIEKMKIPPVVDLATGIFIEEHLGAYSSENAEIIWEMAYRQKQFLSCCSTPEEYENKLKWFLNYRCTDSELKSFIDS